MAFPKGAGRDDLQWEAWLTAMLPRLWLLRACVSELAQLPEAWGRPHFKGGSVSHGPAALATARPCELLPMGALSRGSQGNWGLGAGN